MKINQTFSPVIPALTVIPAQAGIQQLKNAFCLNPLDSRLPPAFARVTGDNEGI